MKKQNADIGGTQQQLLFIENWVKPSVIYLSILFYYKCNYLYICSMIITTYIYLMINDLKP